MFPLAVEIWALRQCNSADSLGLHLGGQMGRQPRSVAQQQLRHVQHILLAVFDHGRRQWTFQKHLVPATLFGGEELLTCVLDFAPLA
jgi:hypothetical protein